MSLKTKEHEGDLHRQLCVSPHNGVQLCMRHVRSGKNYLLRFLLSEYTHSYCFNVPHRIHPQSPQPRLTNSSAIEFLADVLDRLFGHAGIEA